MVAQTRKRPNVNILPRLPPAPLSNGHQSPYTLHPSRYVQSGCRHVASSSSNFYTRRFCMPASQQGDMSSPPPTASRLLATCYTDIIWMCLDSELVQSAVFFAERYYALDHNNHDARHIFATALLHAGRKNSALSLLRDHRCTGCCGCQHLKAQTCNLLGRHTEAREALEASLSVPGYVPTRESTCNPGKCLYLCSRGSGSYQLRCLHEPHQYFRVKPQENASQGILPGKDIFSSKPPLVTAKRLPCVHTCGRHSKDCAH